MAGGRQRSFDEQQALERAMHVFWKKGFSGSSMTDLTTSMGINKPSLYAAFGNKEALFVRATEYYLEQHVRPLFRMLEDDGRPLANRMRDYLRATVAMQCEESRQCGCYISMSVSEGAGDEIPPAARAAIQHAGSYGENCLKQVFRDEIDAGRLASEPGAEELALFVITLLSGTSALARAGKQQTELLPLIDMALGVFGDD